jgi:GT2 family glycosyltransferase
MDISIVIVSWNSQDVLRNCLNSILAETTESNFEVIVVDNASKDQTAQMIMNEYSQIKLIQNQSNLGFAKAVNKGIQASSGKYIALLNPDTIILDDGLELMKTYLDNNPSIGVLGSNLVNEDNSTQASIRRFPKVWDQFLIMTKLRYLFKNSKAIAQYLAKDLDYSMAQQVDQVMGACFMIRRTLLAEIGLLDETFFIWFEEVDFCKRVYKDSNFTVNYYPNAHIVHILGDSFDKVHSIQKQKWFNKSLTYYMKKHHGFFAGMLFSITSPISFLAAYCVSFLQKNKKGKNLVKQNRNKNKQV